MASPKLKITWSDGTVTTVQEPSISGEVCEYDIAYADYRRGLRMHFRHHERTTGKGSGGGAAYKLVQDGSVLLVAEEDIGRVVRIEEDGVETVVSFRGEPVVLPLLRAAASIYVTDAPDNFILSVGSLDAAIRDREPAISDDQIAELAGVTPEILRMGRAAWMDHMSEQLPAQDGPDDSPGTAEEGEEGEPDYAEAEEMVL